MRFKLYHQEDRPEFVFVRMNYGFLCIGTKVEVDNATPQEVMEMIEKAVVISRFNEIVFSRGKTLH